MPDSPLLEIQDVTVRRPGFGLRIPELTLGRGEVVAVEGPSGAGKTSLIQGIFGLPGEGAARPAVAGDVRFAGAPWPGGEARRRLLREAVCLIPQDAAAALDPTLAVGRQLAEITGAPPQRSVEALRELGVERPEAAIGRAPHTLSGGELRRVVLAVALLRRPRLCVLDEPSAGLDGPRVAALAAALATLRDAGTALLIATHDRRLVAALAARRFRVDGSVVRPGGAEHRPWPDLRRRQPAGEPVVRAERVTVRAGRRALLDAVDLAVGRRESVALVGPSGAGKTTLARVLARHVRPDRGRVVAPRRRAAVQLLFQDAAGSLTPHRTIGSLVVESAVPGFDAEAAAASLGLGAELLERRATELSGGQARRAALLRALSAEPDALLLDEPTTWLDRETAERTITTILAAAAGGRALLWITHDDELAEAVGDRVVRIDDGRIANGASV